MCDQCENSTTKAEAPTLWMVEAGDSAIKRFGTQTLRRLWDRITNRGRVPRQSPRVDNQVMRRYMRHYEQRVSELANDLADGSISVRDWGQAMEREISSLHLTADAVGRGGLDNMTIDDLQRANQNVDNQLSYLNRWQRQLETGEAPLDAERIRRRAMDYAQNADVTLNRAAMAVRGIPELPATPKDGTTSCLYNCYCSWRIDDIDVDAGDYDAYWVIDRSRDNCPECIRRAAAWSPLRIRGGVVDRVQANRPGLYT